MNQDPTAPAPLLRVVLPGVVSWSRPRKARGGVRYPPAYARARDAWALLVARAVREARWAPPRGTRYRVTVSVCGGGKRDLDRVCTAALDALQAGGAVRDDCLVDVLAADRTPAEPGGDARTLLEVATLSGAPRPGSGRGRGRPAVERGDTSETPRGVPRPPTDLRPGSRPGLARAATGRAAGPGPHEPAPTGYTMTRKSGHGGSAR
jgi:hypothetical protein